MRILIVSELNSGNTYIDSLCQTLVNQNLEITVSESEFWNSAQPFDLVHVHWLEALFNWKIEHITQSDLNRLQFKLEEFKKTNTKLIITRHNALPHNYNGNSLVIEAYHLFYKFVGGMIHLGNFSETDFQNENPELSASINHTVIPHGNYLNLKNDIAKATARELLNIPLDRFVFLCFGQFRKEKERHLVMKAFKALSLSNKTLLCSAWDLPQAKNSFTSKLKRKKYNLSQHYRLYNTFVSDDNVQSYLNAADVLVVPRTAQLNSGLVYLGLSFGKILIAPAIGNVTEVIEQTNNVLFDPSNSKSVVNAMEKAVSLKDTNLDYENMVFAREHGDWDMIAKQHKAFYGQV
jgi:glycosyltransferase involved in cell wall biosynthesis